MSGSHARLGKWPRGPPWVVPVWSVRVAPTPSGALLRDSCSLPKLRLQSLAGLHSPPIGLASFSTALLLSQPCACLSPPVSRGA